MTINLIAPDGETLVSVGHDTQWGGPVTESSSRDYSQKFTFQVEETGEYIIETKVYSEHVEVIVIKIGQRAE